MSKVEKVPFEEALNLTGYGKFNLLTFLLCGSIIMGMAFELFSVAYLVPASACELLTTSNQQGLMAAVPLIGVIATSHFWGYLADTRGRRKVLCISMTLSLVTGALAAVSPDWITFSVLKFLSSSAVSGAFALSLTLLSECTPEAKRSFLIVLTSSVFLCCNGVMAIPHNSSIHPHMVWLPYMADGFIKSVQTGEEGLTFCERLRSSFNSSTEQVNSDCSMNEFALTMVFGVGLLLAVINSLLSTVMNYFGRKRLLITFQFIAGVAALCVNTSTVWYLSGILVITFIAGILNFGMLTSYSVDVFPTYVKAMAVCLTLMMGRGSAVFGVNLLKLMLDTNCEASFYLFGSIALLGGVIAFLLPSKARPPKPDCSQT